jgi:hypothetical protein
MPQPAIVPFYPYRVRFPYSLVVFPKRGKKAVPIIRRYPVIALSPAVLSSSSAFVPSLNPVFPIHRPLFPRFPGGTLVMNTGSKITGNSTTYYYYGGGGVSVNGGGTFTMNDGKITGNSAEDRGSGVSVGGGGTFTMSDGEISGNSAESGGGGVSVGGGGTFTMNGGEISGNASLLRRRRGVCIRLRDVYQAVRRRHLWVKRSDTF